MGVTDFIIPHNKDAAEMGRDIIRHITVNRLRYNKPVIILLVGDSGEGKSYTALKILKIINDWYKVDTLKNMEHQIVYTPLEYTNKMDALLHDYDKKKLKALIIDEAREIVSSNLWYSFVNRAIADVNALHRTIKPLVLIVVVQFIRDIDVSTRRTVQYYFKCARPLNSNVNLYPFRLWKDDRDIDNPRLRKRTLRGYYVKDNRKIPLRPKKFKITMPPKDIAAAYDKINKERKGKIIRRKLEDLVNKMERELGVTQNKAVKLAEHYMNNPDARVGIVEKKWKHIQLVDGFKDLHGLNTIEVKDFKDIMKEKLGELEDEQKKDKGK